LYKADWKKAGNFQPAESGVKSDFPEQSHAEGVIPKAAPVFRVLIGLPKGTHVFSL
jgi:hypothetical protein